MTKLLFFLPSTQSAHIHAWDYVPVQPLYSYLQHIKVSPCVQPDQKLSEGNRKMPRRHLLGNLWSLLSAGLKMTELQSTEHMHLEVSRM